MADSVGSAAGIQSPDETEFKSHNLKVNEAKPRKGSAGGLRSGGVRSKWRRTQKTPVTPSSIQSSRFEEFPMTQSKATGGIIDTHRRIFGPKLRQKFIENIGLDDSKPLPQANDGEMFFYRESVDVDYSMEIQRQSGVSSCVNSYGGEVETFAQRIRRRLRSNP
jgi:hypothetical protein